MVGILAADADFMIHSLTKLKVLGQEVYLTTTHVSLLLVCVGLFIFAAVVKSKLKDTDGKPGGLQNAAEMVAEAKAAGFKVTEQAREDGTYLVYEKLPPEYDSRVKVMELEEKPKEQYSDIGGLEKQIRELEEAVILPIEQKHLFEAIGIKPPKGVLMYGPPGTGKTMMARACAARSNATFLKLAGSQLIQQYIGEGGKIVRDAFTKADGNV